MDRRKIGRPHTEEAKRKIGNAHRGKVTSKETRRRISGAKTGVPLTEAAKRNISKAYKRPSDDARDRISSSVSRGTGHYMWKGTWLIDGVAYTTCTEAGKALGCCHKTIRNRVKSTKFPNYKFISTE